MKMRKINRGLESFRNDGAKKILFNPIVKTIEIDNFFAGTKLKTSTSRVDG